MNFDARTTKPQEAYTTTADKTFAEVAEAYNRGAVIVFRVKDQMGSNPYSVYSALAHASTTFNEQSELVPSGFTAIATTVGYTNARVEIGLRSDDEAYYSLYS